MATPLEAPDTSQTDDGGDPQTLGIPNDDERIQLVRHVFTNAQELSRLMDQKAYNLMIAATVLTAATISILQIALNPSSTTAASSAPSWAQSVKAVVLTIMGLYVLVAGWIIIVAARVFSARTATLHPRSTHGAIFPLTIVERYGYDAGSYGAQLKVLKADEIVAEYAEQIMELSNIYKQKADSVNSSARLLPVLAVLWLVGMTGALVLLWAR